MKFLSVGIILATVVSMSASVDASTLDKYAVNSSEVTRSSLLASKGNSGSFVGVDHPTQGQVNIIEENGVKYLEISSDFATDRGPDLKVILHNSPSVSEKVQPGEYLNLGALKAFNGSQRYQLPQDLDLAGYQSVAIWCEQYNVTFGYAPLSQ